MISSRVYLIFSLTIIGILFISGCISRETPTKAPTITQPPAQELPEQPEIQEQPQQELPLPETDNLPTRDSPTKPSTSGFTFKKVSQDKLLFTGGYADPTFARLSDGTLVLYVNKFGSGEPSGYHAYTSSDGLNWKEHSSNMPNAATGRAYVTEKGVRFYYPGLGPIRPTDPPASIFSSFSKDGFNFDKEAGERVKPRDGSYLEGPTVIELPDGNYRMYFNENTISSGQNKIGKIWGATSADGLNFIRDEKPTIESNPLVEQMPPDWPQALHPFVLKRPDGKFLMLYNTHSKVYAAISSDGISWKKLGYIGIEGADVDGYYLPDGTLRLYYGDFSPQTSGVVYTVDIQEIE